MMIIMTGTTRCLQGRAISRIFKNTAELVISCNKTAFTKAEIANGHYALAVD